MSTSKFIPISRRSALKTTAVFAAAPFIVTSRSDADGGTQARLALARRWES